MYRREEENLITSVDRTDITNYLRVFLRELFSLEGRKREIRTMRDALDIRDLMNIPKNTTFKSLNDLRSGTPYWYRQDVDCLPSNLGKDKGFIFYFLCNKCQRRVKHLYFVSLIDEPLCRICSRLHYKQPSRKTKFLSRLINKDYLSSEARYMLMKKAGISKDDIDNYLSDFDKK